MTSLLAFWKRDAHRTPSSSTRGKLFQMDELQTCRNLRNVLKVFILNRPQGEINEQQKQILDQFGKNSPNTLVCAAG